MHTHSFWRGLLWLLAMHACVTFMTCTECSLAVFKHHCTRML